MAETKNSGNKREAKQALSAFPLEAASLVIEQHWRNVYSATHNVLPNYRGRWQVTTDKNGDILLVERSDGELKYYRFPRVLDCEVLFNGVSAEAL